MPKHTCILEEEKLCDNCCDCNTCDLDSNKICNNCAECIDKDDFMSIKIDGIELPKYE